MIDITKYTVGYLDDADMEVLFLFSLSLSLYIYISAKYIGYLLCFPLTICAKINIAWSQVVRVLASKGVNMVPFKLNYTTDSVQSIANFTMDVDMLAHFDEWQRSGQDDDYESQDQWPTELRRARVFPAVDYLQV